MRELADEVARSRVARLATLDADGRPHLVPIVFALVGDTLYSAVDAKPKRSRTLRRIENARERPDVTVLVDRYDDGTGRGSGGCGSAGGRACSTTGDEADAALAALSRESTCSTATRRRGRPCSRSTSMTGGRGRRREHERLARIADLS